VVSGDLALVGRRIDLQVGRLSSLASVRVNFAAGPVAPSEMASWAPDLPAKCGFERMESVSLRVLE
jgi:hypothetical protein